MWPPLIATGTGAPTVGAGLDVSKLAPIAGPNGTQVTYAGHALYLYANDHASGDITGQGIGGFWVLGAGQQDHRYAHCADHRPKKGGCGGY